jgi:hypothetical protein
MATLACLVLESTCASQIRGWILKIPPPGESLASP